MKVVALFNSPTVAYNPLLQVKTTISKSLQQRHALQIPSTATSCLVWTICHECGAKGELPVEVKFKTIKNPTMPADDYDLKRLYEK